MRAAVFHVVLRRDAQVVRRPAGKVALDVVHQRREPERLRGVRVELEQPVARAPQVLRVPVWLDPLLGALLERHSVVTGRDWSR